MSPRGKSVSGVGVEIFRSGIFRSGIFRTLILCGPPRTAARYHSSERSPTVPRSSFDAKNRPAVARRLIDRLLALRHDQQTILDAFRAPALRSKDLTESANLPGCFRRRREGLP